MNWKTITLICSVAMAVKCHSQESERLDTLRNQRIYFFETSGKRKGVLVVDSGLIIRKLAGYYYASPPPNGSTAYASLRPYPIYEPVKYILQNGRVVEKNKIVKIGWND